MIGANHTLFGLNLKSLWTPTVASSVSSQLAYVGTQARPMLEMADSSLHVLEREARLLAGKPFTLLKRYWRWLNQLIQQLLYQPGSESQRSGPFWWVSELARLLPASLFELLKFVLGFGFVFVPVVAWRRAYA